MANYVLSRAAEHSLEDIYIYTHDQHGPAQAEAYHEACHRMFGLLADFPYLGRSADEFRPGLRQYPHGSHVIYYSVREGVVHIEQIFHHAQSVRPHMFD